MSKKKLPEQKKFNANVGNYDGVIPVGTIVWKKVLVEKPGDSGWRVNAIAKLLVTKQGVVPEESCRVQVRPCERIITRKCRVAEAYVMAIYAPNGVMKTFEEARSMTRNTFWYHVGKFVRPEMKFDDNRGEVCTSGIHVFRTRKEQSIIHESILY